MDKDNNDKGKIIKLTPKERRVLSSIDKSSKWEDIKAVEEINNEIINLDIYKDFIGLGCSRYLNESAEEGKLDIEEMFRNCREAEKVRVRVKKKEKREEAQSRRSGRSGGRGNIGALVKQDKSIKDIPSKQGEEPKKASKIVDKAKEIAKGISDSLMKDDWKKAITQYGFKVGMDTLFGIIIAVIENSIDNPVGIVALTGSSIALIGKLYLYLTENETGTKIVEGVDKWIRGKINELIDYLTGNDIQVVKKKKKKKPFDRGGGGGKKDDDDDDDDDDDSGDFFEVDFDELEKYEEDKPQQEEKKDTQDLRDEAQVPRGQLNSYETLIPYLLQQQSQQQQQQLVNTNLERLFQRNAENPLGGQGDKKGGEELTPPPAKDPPPQTTPPPTGQDEPDIPKAQNLNPETDTSSFMGSMAGTLGSVLGGTYWLNNHLSGTPEFQDAQEADFIGREPIIEEGQSEVLGRPQAGQAGTGTGGTGQQFMDDMSLQTRRPERNSESLLPRDRPRQLSQDQQQDLEQSRQQIREQQAQIRKMEQDKKEQEKKVNQAIKDMDIRGRAWGLVNPASQGGKMGTDALTSLLMGVGVIDRVRTRQELQNNIISNVNARATQEEQMGLLGDIEQQAEQTRINAMENARQNELLSKENERLRNEMSLIRAREGQEEERKMKPEEAEIIKEQEEALEQARVQRQRVERDRDAELQRIQQEQQDILDRAGETPEQRQAYEMVIGQTRGRPPADAPEQARGYLNRIFGMTAGSNAVSLSNFNRYIGGLDNAELQSRLQGIYERIYSSRESDKIAQGKKKINPNLLKGEIIEIANIIKTVEMREDTPPRQERGDMAVVIKKKKKKK